MYAAMIVLHSDYRADSINRGVPRPVH